MALSTFFADSKLANQIGGLLLLIPELIFVWFAAQTNNSKYVMYVFYWLPVTPACAIFSTLSASNDPLIKDWEIVHTEFINMPASWVVLVLNIPFWLLVYTYLDAIMPSEYGISKHPCFCFMKKPVAEQP